MAIVVFSPIGGAGTQFFDNNGDPLAGGKLWTYGAGTASPTTTYTTYEGSVAQANPIILDSAGRVTTSGIWLIVDTAYKFVLKNSLDTTIATWDHVTGASDSTVTTAALATLTTDVAALDAIGNCYVLATRITSTQSITTGTTPILQFNSETTDLGGNYNPSTYTFTAPVTGVYIIAASIPLIPNTAPAAGFLLSLLVYKNTASYMTLGTFLTDTTVVAAAVSSVFMSGSTVLRLTASDTIDLRLSNISDVTWNFLVASAPKLTIARVS